MNVSHQNIVPGGSIAQAVGVNVSTIFANNWYLPGVVGLVSPVILNSIKAPEAKVLALGKAHLNMFSYGEDVVSTTTHQTHEAPAKVPPEKDVKAGELKPNHFGIATPMPLILVKFIIMVFSKPAVIVPPDPTCPLLS
ncbi:TPA: hypothetical protein DEG21_05290 [Patescibacteria group bacterium]|nr:hypothetical protein [Candidatus Gracilibacteria bacterium]HBY75243.1 hypothetical protein [Candidatus Gracilibacteria bacterium]